MRIDMCTDMTVPELEHRHCFWRLRPQSVGCIDMRADMRADMCADVRADVRADMRVDMRVDIHMGMCIDMRIDMCRWCLRSPSVGVHRNLCRCV